MTKEQAAKDIEKLLSENVGIDVTIDESDLEYGMDVDALENAVDIDRAISEQCEIIYYSRAMEYLSEHDPSLHEAMDCAEEYGYSPKDLNSEILATLLNERSMRQAYWDWRDDIQGILDEIDDEDEDEDIEGTGLITHLAPVYDSRKSFGGKAIVNESNDGTVLSLVSYDTVVATYDRLSGTLDVFDWYSATTARHIREFAAQLGINLPAGKNIKGRYTA